MMKKLHSLLGIFLLVFTFGTTHAQILKVENFEDPALTVVDFPGWTANFPPFPTTLTDPCELNQSLRGNLNSQVTNLWIQYLSEVTTGEDIEVSFDYKIVDLNGNPLPLNTNFGSIDLSYSVDNGTSWTIYNTIDQSDLPTADCANHSFIIPVANLPVGSDFGWRLEVTWNTGDYYVYVDDFRIVEQVSCIAPIHVEIDQSSIGFDSAKVTWEDINPVTEWEVAYCSIQGDPGDGQFPLGTGNPSCLETTWVSVTGTPEYTIPGLTDGTEYWVYVRSVCGPNDESVWSEAAYFQTIAIGTDCSVPIEVTSLQYTHTSSTDVYGAEEYSGNAGANCGSAANLLDGYEVVYHYTTATDDILNIDVTGLTAQNVGVFVYEDCGDIGNFCIGGDATTTGNNLNVNSLFVTQGEDYYIVIASTDGNGNPLNSDYTITINGFNCATWVGPDLPSSGSPVSFVAGQTLYDFTGTMFGVNTTINGATFKWYQDNAGAPGAEITSPLGSVNISDLDCYWVTQNIGPCESPAVQVCFDEFDCNTDLGGITATTGDSVCDSGTMTLTANANTPNVYWYENATGGGVINVGSTFNTPTLSSTTTYYVTEVFLGEGLITNQGNPGPITQETSANDNYGLVIDANQPFRISTIDVYVAGSGDITLELEGPTGPVELGIFSVTAGTANSPMLNTLTLDWTVPTSGTYYLRKTSGPALMYSPSSDANFPYNLGGAGEISSGATSSGTSSNYYYFYNWTVSGPKVLCETSPRTPVDATVNITQSTQVSADHMVVCIGSTTMLHVTSNDGDYQYTWSWVDAAGTVHTDTGADISVTVDQNTTYTVTAVNPNTTCQFVNDITIQIKGAAELDVAPTLVNMCVGESVELKAGGFFHDFESSPTGWQNVNNSTVTAANASAASADWKVVSSPFVPPGGAEVLNSNDGSDFYFSQSNLLGPGASLDASLVSPTISMVGVANASLSFNHYLRYNTNWPAQGKVEISVNQQPFQTLQTYSSNRGTASGFVFETIDLSAYVGASIRIRFNYSGGWGWYWAIDNVTITRNFIDGSISWSPVTDLYFDQDASIPYTGVPTNTVYYDGATAGTHTYTASLDITNCGVVTEEVIINVYQTGAPTGPAVQNFIFGETLGSLDITGQNLKYYIEDANGDLVQVSVNTALIDGTTYYISQTMNGCESGTLEVTVSQDCPVPSNVSVAPPVKDGNFAETIVTWDPPTDLSGVQSYRVVVTDLTDGVEVYEDIVPLTRNFEIVDDLILEHDFEAEVFTVCDPNTPVYGSGGIFSFDTKILGIDDLVFSGLSYYPNPTPGMVYFENQTPIENIVVYSLSGQRVLEKQGPAAKMPMDFSVLASGTYMVAIQVEGVTKVVQIIRE